MAMYDDEIYPGYVADLEHDVVEYRKRIAELEDALRKQGEMLSEVAKWAELKRVVFGTEEVE